MGMLMQRTNIRRISCFRFTLIEMLVVICIIAIIAALLMPALKSAMDSARQIACANNQKQLAIGFMTFADDHNSRIPPTNHGYLSLKYSGGAYIKEFGLDPDGSGAGGYWVNAIGPYLGHDDWLYGYKDLSNGEQLNIQRAARTSVANCPAQYPTEANFDRIMYGKSSRLSYFASKYSKSTSSARTTGEYARIPSIKYPSKALLVADTCRSKGMNLNPLPVDPYYAYMMVALDHPGSGSSNNPPNNYRGAQWLRHNLGCNVLFVTGRVEHVSAEKMFNNLTNRHDVMGALRLRD